MTWAHENTRITDGKILYKPGTLVYINLNRYLPMKGNEDPRINIENYVYRASKRHGPYPIAMILDLDNLETFYQVLIEDTKYWICTQAISLVKINHEAA